MEQNNIFTLKKWLNLLHAPKKKKKKKPKIVALSYHFCLRNKFYFKKVYVQKGYGVKSLQITKGRI